MQKEDPDVKIFWFDDCQLDIKILHAIMNYLKNGHKVCVCNSLFCDTRYLEYFLSCIGIMTTGLIKFIFFNPNPAQSALNIKKREIDENKIISLTNSLEKLSLIYTRSSMKDLIDKYAHGNYCIVDTYSPKKAKKSSKKKPTKLKTNKNVNASQQNSVIVLSLAKDWSLSSPPKIDWSLLSPNL